jgi:hypothetical protein
VRSVTTYPLPTYTGRHQITLPVDAQVVGVECATGRPPVLVIVGDPYGQVAPRNILVTGPGGFVDEGARYLGTMMPMGQAVFVFETP